MALTDNDSNTQAPVTGAKKPAAREERQPSHKWNMGGSSSVFGAPITGGLGDNYLNKLVASLTKAYEKANSDYRISLIQLDRDIETTLTFSAVVIAIALAADPSKISFYTLIASATGQLPISTMESFGDAKYERTLYYSDALDVRMRELVRRKLSEVYPGGKYYDNDGLVLAPDFDPDNIPAVVTIAANAAMAAGTFLRMDQPGFRDFDLGENPINDTVYSVLTFGSDAQIQDAAGLPVRSDVCVTLTTQPNQQGSQAVRNLNSNGGARELSQISAYVDLLYRPAGRDANGYGIQLNNAQTPTQRYVPRIVITDVNCKYGLTPATVLMAISSVFALPHQNNWVQVYKPNMVVDGVDLRDIGALNLDADATVDPSTVGYVPTKTQDATLEAIGAYIMKLVEPRPLVSIDIPDAGAQTWYLSALANANNSRAAHELVIEAAKQLTHGAFGEFFETGAPVVLHADKYLIGYWTDHRGRRRDIRDFDLLAFCNAVGHTNPELIRDWSDTITKYDSYPVEMRLSAQRKMIAAVSKETAVILGTGTRVTLSGKFLDALARALSQVRFSPIVKASSDANAFQNTRGTANFLNDGFISQGNNFMASNVAAPASNRYGNSNNSRW